MTKRQLTKLREWLRTDGGLSSYTIVWVLVPELRDFADECARSFGVGHAPVDPSDFNRCRQVLSLIPGGVGRLDEVARAFHLFGWRRLVDNWDELDALFVEESKNESGMAPKLYERMKQLLKVSRAPC